VPPPRARVRRAVLEWYAANGRPLAFRATSDPWAILVSEVMAQQTQAARAAGAWAGFMATYPTPAALASAPRADVLRAWRGLGHNRRALLLQRAAQAIVADHGGAVPRDLAALRRLPGVGPYTARAVAALAFGARVGAVDTNVRRVLSRAFLDGEIGAAPAGVALPAALQALADDLAPPNEAGRWTHALMDLGAALCRSRDPRCEGCPLRPWCRYARAREPGIAATRQPAAGAERPKAISAVPFAATRRWLRGRILDRLRDLPDGDWLAFDEAIGQHPLGAVGEALAGLARDGLVELRPTAQPAAPADPRAADQWPADPAPADPRAADPAVPPMARLPHS
jgi:A/G-specific adenine glycosylase